MAVGRQHTVVSPTEYLTESLTLQHDDKCDPCLIILNTPIADIVVLSRLWRHTGYHLCADGGANQLFDLFQNHLELRSKFVRTQATVCGFI